MRAAGGYAAEWKYDGQRAQVHVLPDGTVKLFSRKLDDMTLKYPELAAAIAFNGRAAACGLLQRSHHVDYWQALLSAYAPLMAFTVDEGVVAERRAQRQQRQGQERARAASRPSGGLSPAAAARLAGAAMNSTQRLAAHLRALRANVAAAERAAALHRRTAEREGLLLIQGHFGASSKGASGPGTSAGPPARHWPLHPEAAA